jgi:hypothetical protein
VTVGGKVAVGGGVAVGNTGAVVAVTTGIDVDVGTEGSVADGVTGAIGETEGASCVSNLLKSAVPVRFGVGKVNAVGALDACKLQPETTPRISSARSI